ncbi:MAG: hypothetical protein GC162_20470 [Planctomycetes bacterium]|nr:hypothetical protein [Planctomycetota bacterium]
MDDEWIKVTRSFTAGTTSSTLKLKENGSSSQNDPNFDNISVTIVPTPAALPAGLALMGLTVMRRRHIA